MANFDMIPPDPNELFGFNEMPEENVGKGNWGWVSVVVIVFVIGIIIGKQKEKRVKNNSYF